MNQSTPSFPAVKKTNLIRARVTIRGVRPLFQHVFGEESIPLQKTERTGVAGNDPEEWRRSCMTTSGGQLYIRNDYVFGSLRDGAVYTKSGKGSIQSKLVATLQIEEAVILLNRWMPALGEPPRDPTAPVYIDVRGVKNPSTKARNVRYRLAACPGWECSFTLLWDRTLVSREQMKAILIDAGTLCGLGNGRRIGMGRFEVAAYEELIDAPQAIDKGIMGPETADRMGAGREEMPPVSGTADAYGMPHRPHRKRKEGKQSVEKLEDALPGMPHPEELS